MIFLHGGTLCPVDVVVMWFWIMWTWSWVKVWFWMERQIVEQKKQEKISERS